MVAVPDWSYRTVLRPLMLAAGAERSRRVATGTLRTLARLPLGLKLIDFIGHVHPDPRLRTRAGPLELPAPIALGALIDPHGDALAAFARFGVGMIEIGPVAEEATLADPGWRVDLGRGAIDAAKPILASLDDAARNLAHRDPAVPIAVRIAAQESAAVRRIIARLEEHAALFIVEPSNADDAKASRRPVLINGVAGPSGVWLRGDAAAVREMRSQLSPGAILIASGATEPHDVRSLLKAGADVVSIDAGLVCSGPGLIKRCNEALLSDRTSETATPEPFTLDAARSSWFWATLMGVGMIFGGILAVIIASTRVVLPYDESLCGLTRAQMASLNPRLLPFMAHDRVSLAGTMLSIGILYAALGWYGIRRRTRRPRSGARRPAGAAASGDNSSSSSSASASPVLAW